jgi:hypothetical protein
MSNYRDLKRRHETAVVDEFVGWPKRTSGANWTVTSRPNPPDAIITNGSAISWVEHADLYRNWEEARSETSFVTPGKTHIPHSQHPICDPGRQTAMALMALLQDKLSNSSYRSAYEHYGQGFLVISVRDPLFDNDTVADIDRAAEQMGVADDNGYFCKIYLAIRSPQDLLYREVTYRKD